MKEADLILRSATVEKRGVSNTEDFRLEAIKGEILSLDISIEGEHRSLAGSSTQESQSSLQGYSLCRAINLAGQGRLDGYEAEISQEIAHRSGKAAAGFYVPHSALMEQRAMSVLGDSGTYGGGYVATENRGFINALRPFLAVGKAGATIIDGLTSSITIPRQSAASTASWKAETANLDEATPIIDQLELSPKRVGAYTVLSKQLIIQSTPDVEKLVRMDLLAACATALDAAAINGAGGTAPTGVLQTAGIGSVIGGTNGAIADWQDIVDLVAAIEGANAIGGSMAFISNSSVAAKLRATARITGTDSRFILEGSTLLDQPFYVSSNVPSNLTKGTAVGIANAIIFGDWSNVILASFGEGVDLVVDPYTNAVAGQTRVIANSYVDVGIRRAAAFAAMKDALTA